MQHQQKLKEQGLIMKRQPFVLDQDPVIVVVKFDRCIDRKRMIKAFVEQVAKMQLFVLIDKRAQNVDRPVQFSGLRFFFADFR